MERQRKLYSNVNRIVGVLFLGFFAGITLGLTETDTARNSNTLVQQFLKGATERLFVALSDFEDELSTCYSTSSIHRAREKFERVREAWKAIEPLAEYADPTYVQQFINGAPLPRLDVKSLYIDVLSPSGLQVIDEMMYDDERQALDSIESIRIQLASLRQACTEAVAVMRNTHWTDRMILESCRSGLIRIMSLGLTAFDRPSSPPRISDDVPPLQTIAVFISYFEEPLAKANDKALYERISTTLNKSVSELRSNVLYDDFDRLEFIRNQLDPLYGMMFEVQSKLQIEFADEAFLLTQPLSPRARSMFRDDVIDVHAGSGLTRSSVSYELKDLGRTLFFDPALSANSDRSCASCHMPELAFTDGRPKSIGLNRDGFVKRNAPTLINAVYAKRFFTDMRASRISEVISHVVTDPKEFGHSLHAMVDRLKTSREYQQVFSRVFKEHSDRAIDATNISLAVAAYLTTLVNFDTKVDRYLRGEDVAVDSGVRRGFNLFMGRAACGTCHFAPTFSGLVPPAFLDSESEILGVPTTPDTVNAVLDPDLGRYSGNIRERSTIFKHSFKTPTIRNISLTAPYMHNGAFTTLRDVLTFYDKGGGARIGIHLQTQTLKSDRLDFSEQDFDDLLAFLNALTDTTGLTSRPEKLPAFEDQILNKRKIGGDY